mgnify:CR=1 FL=1
MILPAGRSVSAGASHLTVSSVSLLKEITFSIEVTVAGLSHKPISTISEDSPVPITFSA